MIRGLADHTKLILPLFIFLAAFSIRIYFACTHRHYDNVFAVRGVPFSDGHLWTMGAMLLAEGKGLGDVLRPGLSVALAFFYPWLGYSFHTITALNIVVGSLTALFIFLIARTVFNESIAIAAAGFFVLDPSQIVQIPQATTEPLGLLFFTTSVYCLLLADRGGRRKPALISGVLLGLSNLTRPLTLVCAPFYAGQLVLSEWLRTRGLKRALVPAIALLTGIVLTLSPWLIRQRLVQGVWSLSTNLGEALYAATSPKYKTWTSRVRADADRAGVKPTMGARYKYFIAESLKNIRRDPAFYTGQVARSCWQYLNCFDSKIRSTDKSFPFREWTQLVEAQVLFLWITITLLVVTGLRLWAHSGISAGCVFLAIAAGLIMVWRLWPVCGGIIVLATGMVISFAHCSWRAIALLGWSVLGTVLASALFNNTILYRAVLMTDWIFSLFYLAAFYFGTTLISNLVLGVMGKAPAAMERGTAADGVDPLALAFDDRTKAILKSVAVVFVILVLLGSVRLFALNFGIVSPSEPLRCQLSTSEKQKIIEQLRGQSPAIEQVLADPKVADVKFIEPTPPITAPVSGKAAGKRPTGVSSISSVGRTELVIRCEPLSRYIYYFPRGAEFRKRNSLFMKRSFDCSIFSSASGTMVFPGKIPRLLQGRPVVLVGWIEGIHPGWPGKILQCIAVIPVLGENGALDYENAVMAQPRTAGILPAKGE